MLFSVARQILSEMFLSRRKWCGITANIHKLPLISLGSFEGYFRTNTIRTFTTDTTDAYSERKEWEFKNVDPFGKFLLSLSPCSIYELNVKSLDPQSFPSQDECHIWTSKNAGSLECACSGKDICLKTSEDDTTKDIIEVELPIKFGKWSSLALLDIVSRVNAVAQASGICP